MSSNITRSARARKGPAPKKEKQNSQYDFFGLKAVFTNEPLWFKLVVLLIITGCLVVTAILIKQWLVPGILAGGAGSKVSHWVKGFRGRAP
jgi:hypothetical protein